VEGAPTKTRGAVRVPPKRAPKAVRVPAASGLEYAPPKRASKAVRVPPKKGAASKRARVEAPEREPSKRPPAPTCAACGSSDVIPILYGLPVPEVYEESERGEIELGGCCIGPGDPAWRCRACDEAFGVREFAPFEPRS
jgi:hypothetical protein